MDICQNSPELTHKDRGRVASVLNRLADVKIGAIERVGKETPYVYRLKFKPTVINKAQPVAKGPRKTKAWHAEQAAIAKARKEAREAKDKAAVETAAKQAADPAWPSETTVRTQWADVDERGDVVRPKPEPKPEPTSTDKWFRERWPSAGGLLDVGTLFRQLQYHIDNGIKAIDADAIPDEIIKAQFVKRFL